MTGLNIHIYPSTIENESRILKITEYLAKSEIFSQIWIVGIWKEGLPHQECIDAHRTIIRVKVPFQDQKGKLLYLVLKFIWWNIYVLKLALSQDVKCVNCHSLPVLPLSVCIKYLSNAKLIYDTHELETETAAIGRIRRLLSKKVERILIKLVDVVCVVNRSIADWYQKTYNITDVKVVRNIPINKKVVPNNKNRFRKHFNIGPEELVFLYQGLLSRGRGLEKLLETFSQLNADKHIIFMGYGELSAKIISFAEEFENIHYQPAVAPDEVLSYTVDADIGLALIENVCLSYYYCLPNKLFEYILSGVPIIASDFPEMAAFIDKYKCGWKILPETIEIYSLIKNLNKQDILSFKHAAIKATHKISWENEFESLQNIYQSLK